MYKKQLTAQKYLCLAAIIASAVLFVYSLGIMTDLYECLYTTMRISNGVVKEQVSGAYVYYAMQNFNAQFLNASVGMILLGVLLFITNTNVRRKYYIGNYIAVGLYSASSVGISVWAHMQIETYKAMWLQVDFDALKEYAEMWNTGYTTSTLLFDLHYAVFGLLIVISALLIANCVWKKKLMNAEQALLARGKEKAV